MSSFTRYLNRWRDQQQQDRDDMVATGDLDKVRLTSEAPDVAFEPANREAIEVLTRNMRLWPDLGMENHWEAVITATRLAMLRGYMLYLRGRLTDGLTLAHLAGPQPYVIAMEDPATDWECLEFFCEQVHDYRLLTKNERKHIRLVTEMSGDVYGYSNEIEEGVV